MLWLLLAGIAGDILDGVSLAELSGLVWRLGRLKLRLISLACRTGSSIGCERLSRVGSEACLRLRLGRNKHALSHSLHPLHAWRRWPSGVTCKWVDHPRRTGETRSIRSSTMRSLHTSIASRREEHGLRPICHGEPSCRWGSWYTRRELGGGGRTGGIGCKTVGRLGG